MGYTQPDPNTVGWDGAAELLHTDSAAMTLMGDWAKGYFLAEGMKAEVDFDAFPAPGTDGSFIFITDTFGLPKSAPHRDNAVELLTILGSVEAEDAFNPIKGSIPARTDCDKSKYDAMANKTMVDYAAAYRSTNPSKGLVPSSAHGSAAPEAFLADLNLAFEAFRASPDGATLVQAIVNIYPELKQ